jgi:hypothetical protein
MRKALFLFRVWVLSASIFVPTAQMRQEPKAGAGRGAVIKAGRLVDVKAGHALEKQTIVIEGERVNSVGADLPIPGGDPLKDVRELGRVKFVMIGGVVIKEGAK